MIIPGKPGIYIFMQLIILFPLIFTIWLSLANPGFTYICIFYQAYIYIMNLNWIKYNKIKAKLLFNVWHKNSLTKEMFDEKKYFYKFKICLLVFTKSILVTAASCWPSTHFFFVQIGFQIRRYLGFRPFAYLVAVSQYFVWVL